MEVQNGRRGETIKIDTYLKIKLSDGSTYQISEVMLKRLEIVKTNGATETYNQYGNEHLSLFPKSSNVAEFK